MTTAQPALPFSDFFASIEHGTKSDVLSIKKQYPQFCQEGSVLDDGQIRSFVDAAEKKILDQTVARIFSLVISPFLLSKIVEDPTLFRSETIRAYVVLRYCDDKNKNCKEVVTEIKKATISDEFLRYKFVSHLARRNPKDLAENISLFDMEKTLVISRIAEKVLRFKPDAFFGYWSGFKKAGTPPRVVFDKFYLRELSRSGHRLEELLQDDDFIDSFENTSPSLIQAIYERFRFGEKFIQMFKKERQHDIEEKKLFERFIQYPYSKEFYQKSHIKGELGRLNIFDSLSDQEQSQLVAMLFLLKLSNYDTLKQVQLNTLLEFLDEISQFPDPLVRFASVALFLDGKERELPSISILNTLGDRHLVKDYPKIYTLVCCQCGSLLGQQDTTWLADKWRSDEMFRKSFPLFLVELFFSSKVADEQRQAVLLKVFKNSQFRDSQILINLSYCISRGLTSDFITEETSPTDIITTNFQDCLQRLGEPYHCSLSLELSTKLEYIPDIISYSQSLVRLPDPERRRMVEFFFQFLHLMAEDKMKEERFNTPPLRHLFDPTLTGPRPFKTPLDLNVWKQESSLSIQKIQDLFPEFFPNLDIAKKIQEAFDSSLLEGPHYSHFYDHLQGKPWENVPKFSTAARDCKENPSDINKKEILRSVILLQLVKGESDDDTPVQLSDERKKDLLGQLKKISSDPSLKHIKTLHSDLSTMLGIKQWNEYRIFKSSDPYLLFRIGSIGQTCQRVSGNPANNKCLLAYPCDGKNALIYAKNKRGDVEARAIIRFFYAETQGPDKTKIEDLAPVLFLEPIYPANKPPILQTSITLAAIECAKKLDVPLVRSFKKQEKKDNTYPHRLQTMYSPAPFEYFDGLPQGAKICEHVSPEVGSNIISCSGSNFKLLYDPINPKQIRL